MEQSIKKNYTYYTGSTIHTCTVYVFKNAKMQIFYGTIKVHAFCYTFLFRRINFNTIDIFIIYLHM